MDKEPYDILLQKAIEDPVFFFNNNIYENRFTAQHIINIWPIKAEDIDLYLPIIARYIEDKTEHTQVLEILQTHAASYIIPPTDPYY